MERLVIYALLLGNLGLGGSLALEGDADRYRASEARADLALRDARIDQLVKQHDALVEIFRTYERFFPTSLPARNRAVEERLRLVELELARMKE